MISRVFIPILAKDLVIPFEDVHLEYKKGDFLIIQMDNNQIDYCRFLQSTKTSDSKKVEEASWKIIRRCSEEDLNKMKENKKTSCEYRKKVQETIKQLELEMSLTGVQLSFDNRNILVTFTAEARVDFRELVKTLAGTFKKKIQLLQIGARDRAKLVGGFGVCGRELCCKRHLTNIPSVSMDAAREQNIAFKGAPSLSGCCEKLKCCLNFEKDQYKKLKKLFPKFGSSVKIKNDDFVIIGLDILNKRIKLKSAQTYITLELDEFNEKTKK